MHLTDQDQLKERIRFKIEMIKLFAVLLIATCTGIATLLLGQVDSGVEIVFLATGMMLAVVCIRILYKQYRVTINLINHGKS